MGYSTSYELSMQGKEVDRDFVIAKLKSITGYSFSDCDEIVNDGVTGKYYDLGKRIIELSTYFKDTVFVLEGIGEEFPDAWRMYAKNGKSVTYKAEITFPEFKEDDLK